MSEPTRQVDHEPADPAPFLRITGTYPTPGGRFETVQLEMNLGDDETLGDDVDAGDGGDGPTRSWFIDFCTFVIDALRRPPKPTTIVLTGTGVPGFLADRIRHAEDCNGSCGQTGEQAEPAGGAPAGQTEVV